MKSAIHTVDGIRFIGLYEFHLWRTRWDNRSAIRWRGFVGKGQELTPLCGRRGWTSAVRSLADDVGCTVWGWAAV